MPANNDFFEIPGFAPNPPPAKFGPK